ncbi:hypothetical protein TNCV_3546561 [Trichonephila clavipes]|nr:hypothetical protein TNCV_3546561 [Trichonephila clavipes]
MLLRSSRFFTRVNPTNAVLCLGLETRLSYGIEELLAICEAYSLGFFIEHNTKQDSQGGTTDGQPDLGLDVKIFLDL